jgi:hypothetical protein
LTKTSFAQRLQHLIPIAKVVLHDDLIISSIIIVALVMRLARGAFNLSSVETQEVHFLVIEDL